MDDLTYLSPDSGGALPDFDLIGQQLFHTGRRRIYVVTGFCWLGESDEWGYLHHEMRFDGLPGPTVARPLSHIDGNRSNGEPRYQLLHKG